MNRIVLIATLALAPASALLAAEDKVTVYKTTTEDGVNVYSQTELEGSQARQVSGDTGEAPPAGEQAPAKSPVEQACEKARANYELLSSDKRLQRDKDGDGVMEEYTAEERAAETDIARRQMQAYCAQEPES
ncbi:DUF4124 domain-containing protein [Arenimonas fontis]|uniref:DUF4124 domain-containing protein n=1 Tax=Arenimonas fontis TaxID=2608255 RepID=A0A5B2Z9L4_9GAMM|nr:DUF4124 domain-containing protein [Arenimonas fontis]KAA2285338.1 DUF4124 domain-containing protein [Arenimonas fontis]